MNDPFEMKWYNYLLNKCNILDSGIIYRPVGEKRIKLSDIFVQQSIVQDAVYGIARGILIEADDESEGKHKKYTIEDLLSTQKYNRHLVIGALGSGKTSLLNHIISQLAEYHLSGETTSSLIVKAFKDKYVSYLSLKEFTKDNETRLFENFNLEEWIIDTLKRVCSISEEDKVVELFTNYSAKGIVLIVDGLDEIDGEERKDLLKLLNFFSENPDNVVIATIRKEVLVEDSWISEISGYQQITLADFNRDQIRDYICKWKEYVTKDIDMSEIDTIVKTIFDNRYLKELAANPLFLALMMLISDEEGEFPKNRTRVYEEAIQLIVGRWNEKYFEHKAEITLIREALEQAAFNGMDNLIGQSKRSGDVNAFITEAFANVFPDRKVAEYIKTVSEKTGIIVQTEGTKYSFALQSFMEYLAGSYISKKRDIASFIDQYKDKLIPWQEVIVFGITQMAMDRLGVATSVLFKWVKNDYQKSKKIEPEKVLIAGIIAQELSSESDDDEIVAFNERIKTWLREYVCDKNIPYRLRFEIGNVLARLGDDRDGVGLKMIEGRYYPDIKWIRIPEGVSEFGSPEGHINKVHTENICEYLISKYPITNEQFGLFLTKGYLSKEYWTDEGWAWVNGQDYSYFNSEVSGRYTEERKKQYELWLSTRNFEKRKEPFWWQDYPWNIANRPVVGITWYEAVAYCNWLNVECRIQLIDILDDNEIVDAQVCLPTLEEWEKAARGPQSKKYPWGKQLDYKNYRGNFDICDLNETSAVGIFSEGKSAYDVYDLAGNVYEWISTGVVQVDTEKWEREPEDLEGKYERLVKGGSWNMEYERAKAAYDEWDYPIIFDQNTGFRPIVRLKKE